jgi:hypothetical protein
LTCPDIFEIGKPDFKDIEDKLVVDEEKLPLSVFINDQSWLLFEKAKSYLSMKGIGHSFS